MQTQQMTTLREACLLAKPADIVCSLPSPGVSACSPKRSANTSYYRQAGATDYAKLFKQCGNSNARATSPSHTLPVLVCGYNEEAEDFVHTLRSVAAQQPGLCQYGLSIKVLIILDGWDHVSASMRQFCSETFPAETHGTWLAELEGIDKGHGGCSAVSLQTSLGNLHQQDEQEVVLDVTLLIKKHNRKKHDSIRAFLRGFAMVEGADFAAMTDSGTSFGRDCFAKQIAALNASPGCAGVTGHQRIGQASFHDAEHSLGVTATLLHGFQTLEKELEFSVWHFVSYFGFLPLLHGQCNVWRMESLTKPVSAKECLGKSVLDIFEDEMDTLKNTSSLSGANLYLVEDRLLSLLAVMLSGDLKFVPEAIFYYRSEISLLSLFSQRRRWNNGTAAAHLKTIALIYRFWRSRDLVFKLVAGAQSLAQLGSDVALACITPAVQFHMLMTCIESLSTEEPRSPWQAILEYEQGISVTVVSVLFAFMMAHYCSGSGVAGSLVTITMACLAASVGCVLFVFMMLAACWQTTCPTPDSSVGILMAIAIVNSLNYIGFLAHSAIHRDLESISLVFAHLPACLFWQAYGWFVTVHASMLHAISWGNRPDDTTARNGMRCKSALIAVLVFILNTFAIILRKKVTHCLPYVYLLFAGPTVLMKLTALPLRVLTPKRSSLSLQDTQ